MTNRAITKKLEFGLESTDLKRFPKALDDYFKEIGRQYAQQKEEKLKAELEQMGIDWRKLQDRNRGQ